MNRFSFSACTIFCLLLPGLAQAQNGTMPAVSFDDYPVYEGKDLGLTYTRDSSVFKLWSPPAEAVRLHFYAAGDGGKALETREMKRGEKGVWALTVKGDYKGRFYAFQAKINGKWMLEVPDPYVKAVGANGKRGMVLHPHDVYPSNWDLDKRPALKNYTDIILYELHVRDASSHASSGVQNKGLFIGLAEERTTNPKGQWTALSHIRQLGVTHVHLLPVFDYRSIDETEPRGKTYNWGYDPQNYNVPEGSYSTNPRDGAVRIREFKQMVKAFHDNGLRVVMDVVYNHTGETETSLFNQLVPGYYYRQNADGGFSNASACGNEIASERPMVRKFILESVAYWASEYRIDGFRFDLMGIHDIETMNQVRKTLDAIDPSIFVYGEGWTAGASPLPDSERALKANVSKMERIAAFSDDFRDGLRGHVFTPTEKGFVSGKPGLKESVKFGIAGSVFHPQVDYSQVNYSKSAWAKEPYQTITYVSCHDNHTLWDRLAESAPEAPESSRLRMQKLALAMVLTSQGVPFLHAGSEMLRTKQGHENSFNLPDSINQINWNWKTKNEDLFDFVRALIDIRKQHPAFRMPSAAMIRQQLTFLDTPGDNMVAYLLTGNANGDSWKNILVIFNGSSKAQGIAIPPNAWTVVVNPDIAHPEGVGNFKAYNLLVPSYSAMVMYTNDDLEPVKK